MAEAGQHPVAVCEVDVCESTAPDPDGIGHVALFDVHVEEVRQDKGVFQLIFFNESHPLSQTVDEVGLITVERI